MLEQLAGLAYSDWLTGLPNRRALVEELRRIHPMVSVGFPVDLAWVDIQGFGEVNRAQGYTEGDRVLRRFAARALELAPLGLIVYRWGGDEFVGFTLGNFMPRAAVEHWCVHLSWHRAIRYAVERWGGVNVDVAPPWRRGGGYRVEDGNREHESPLHS